MCRHNQVIYDIVSAFVVLRMEALMTSLAAFHVLNGGALVGQSLMGSWVLSQKPTILTFLKNSSAVLTGFHIYRCPSNS